MSSLHDLLSREGFQRRTTTKRRQSSTAAIQLCRHRGNVTVPRKNLNSRTRDWLLNQEEPNPAARSAISTLSAYLDRFSSDSAFRCQLRERSAEILRAERVSSDAVILNLEAAMECAERLAAKGGRSEVGDSIRRLRLIGCGDRRNCSFSACAQIYLAVIYKMEGDDNAAVRMLLRPFAEAPAVARKSLMPELWENFFLPHLQDCYLKDEDQIDEGTAKLAAHFRDLVKLGFNAPKEVSVKSCSSSEREDGASNGGISVHRTMGIRRRENAAPAGSRKSSYSLRLFTCRSQDPNKAAILPSAAREAASNPNFSDLLSIITSSENLPQCESAARDIAKLWIDSGGEQNLELSLSSVPALEGLMEISFSSSDPQTLDSIICLLAELASRNESNRRAILNADPQLELFLKLMNVHHLFLKVSILLYLLKPKAKQMLSANWVPLVLRILELGDRKLTLFSIQCRAKSAAFYLLDQLLTGFDVDRNVENARQMVSQGGLQLLMKRMEMGDVRERKLAAGLITTCVRADGSCREFLAATLSKGAVLELLLGSQLKSKGSAISLLVELIKLDRRTQITAFLHGLKNEGCMNTMHILFVYLQQAPSDQRPLVAAILLQLDLLGDNFQHSIYREEGIDALVMALESKSSKKVQESCARALMILGGRFSVTGEAIVGNEMLRRAGFDDNPGSSFCSKDFDHQDAGNSFQEEDDVATEDWQRSLALVLLSRGHKRLLAALAGCMAEGIPSLSHSSLVTVAWMSHSLSSSPLCASLWSAACSALIPQLIRCLSYDVAVEERVLACFSLLNLCNNPECRSMLTHLDEQSQASLNDLTWLTWTARELSIIGASDSMSFLKI